MVKTQIKKIVFFGLLLLCLVSVSSLSYSGDQKDRYQTVKDQDGKYYVVDSLEGEGVAARVGNRKGYSSRDEANMDRDSYNGNSGSGDTGGDTGRR